MGNVFLFHASLPSFGEVKSSSSFVGKDSWKVTF